MAFSTFTRKTRGPLHTALQCCSLLFRNTAALKTIDSYALSRLYVMRESQLVRFGATTMSAVQSGPVRPQEK